ncbi:MAG: hypothetical protein E7490_03965 [Ruminococcaceae bacterium]|nr:hypothetical protein [Oscillospiraceae bacterium]
MKKLIATLTALTMTVILAVSASAATSPDRAAVKLNGSAAGYNQSANDYLTYSRTVKSYMEETDDGFRRIEYYDGKLIVEDYYSDLTLKFRKIITKTSYVFGGYYQGSDYCYLVWGKNNSSESDDQEVLLIEKWTKGLGERVSTVSVYGANTYIPFDAGSLRMTETAGKLYIHTSHEMYMSDDGYHHQANMTFVVNTSTMTVVDSWYDVMNIRYGYVSHSFNQFIETDGNYIYRVDHGDAYPRAVVITKCAVGDDITNVSYINALPISGAIGDNFTGVSVGGVELTANNIVIAGNTADQSADYISYNSMRNIFITVTDKNLSSTSVKYITNYTDDDDVEICTPHLLKINDNKFLVMWEELKDYTIYTRLCTIDGQGNLTSDIVDTYMYLSDCAPVLFSDGLVYWFKSDTTGATLYRVNPDDIDSANNGQVTKTENFKAAATDTTVTLSWDLNSSATCYNVEKYENGYWYPVVGIAQNSITATKVEDLTPATTYKYRIVPCKLIGDTWVYGESTEVTVTTAIPGVTGFAVSSKNSTSATLKWNKNSYANVGYSIEIYDGIKWSVVKTADSNATSCTVEGLVAGTAYKFRIRSIAAVGTQKVYSAYSSEISATTDPSAVTGLREGGRSGNALRLNWDKNNTAGGYIIEMYKGGKWTRIARIAGNTTTTYRVTGLEGSTTYQFRMRTFKTVNGVASYSGYTDAISLTTNPSAVSGLSEGGRASNALRLNWTKNTSAGGYIIEMYKDNKWVRVARIAGNTKTTYRVTGLEASTTYNFRIKAFKTINGTAYYSGYSTISLTTNPSSAENLRIGGKAGTALRLNWNKNDSAKGYIVEMLKDGKWTRVKKITSSDTVTYRVAGLEKGTTYSFRVRTYNMVGSTAYYGGASYVDGTTNS